MESLDFTDFQLYRLLTKYYAITHTKRNTPNKKSRRVGRGGKRGKTSGRGTKGQKARAGRKLRPELRDTIKKIPKMRGHGKNRARTVNAEKVRAQGVNLGVLENVFQTEIWSIR